MKTNMAKFSKESIFNKQMRTMEFPQYTQDEFDSRFIKYKQGELSLQEALPLLSSNSFCFILYGVTESEWNKNSEKHITGALVYD